MASMPPAWRVFQSISRQGRLLDVAWWKGTQLPAIAETFAGVSDRAASLRWPFSTYSCEPTQLPRTFYAAKPQAIHQEGSLGFAATKVPPCVNQRNFSGSTSGSVEGRSGAGGESEGLAPSPHSDAAASHPAEAVQAESPGSGALSEDAHHTAGQTAEQTAEHASSISADSEGAEKASESQSAEAGSPAADPTSTLGSDCESAIGSPSGRSEGTSAISADSEGADKASDLQGAEAGSAAADPTSTLGSGCESAVGSPSGRSEGTSAISAESEGAEKASVLPDAEAGSPSADPTSTSGSGCESGIEPPSAKSEGSEVKEGPGDQATGASVDSASSSGEQQPEAGASQVGSSEGDGSPAGGQPPNEGEEAGAALKVLTRPEPNILSYVADLFAEARVALTIRALKLGIERGFDVEDFKRGAEVAFRAFMEYYPKGDFQTLQNMVSPMLLKHLQAVWDELKEQGKVMECTLEDLQGVQVTDMDIFIRSPPFCDGVPSLEGYDENKWLAVSVRFDSTEKYNLRGPEGKLLISCIDKRGHVLKFVRQLPQIEKVPLDELESPWYIVNI